MLHLNNISFKCADGPSALKNITVEINRGIIGLLGPEKSGKTALLRILSSELTPTTGTAYLNEYNLHYHTEEKRVKVGYLPQVFGFYQNNSVGAQLKQIAKFKRFIDSGNTEACVSMVLHLFNLFDQRHVKISECSLYEVRSIGIAQAFLGNPELVLLDSPFENLTTPKREILTERLKGLQQDKVIIIASQNPGDIENLCEELLFLEDGKLTYYGSPDILKEPLSRQLTKTGYLGNSDVRRQEGAWKNGI